MQKDQVEDAIRRTEYIVNQLQQNVKNKAVDRLDVVITKMMTGTVGSLPYVRFAFILNFLFRNGAVQY